jgi:hypothetical protein
MKNFRWHAAAAVLIVLAGTARVASTFFVFSHTIDEPDNLAAGVEYLSTGRYLYHDENPPLARLFTAVGPYLAGERYYSGPAAHVEGLRILGTGEHYDRVLALARAGILPFFWTAAVVVYLWAYRVGGGAAALFATALFTSLPPVLGLSAIANTDMALCATVGLAALLSFYWAERPTPRRSVLLGLAIALACVSKFTAIPFLAAGWAAMLLYARPSLQSIRECRRAIAIVVATTVVAIWAIYGFTFARVEFLHARLPAPRFFTGIEKVWLHQHTGHASYLFGRRSDSGFWYYFPAVLAIKTPLGFLALALLTVRRVPRRNVALPLVFSAAILAAAMASRVNIGVRYILPVYLGLSVAAGVAMTMWRGRVARVALVSLLVWHLVSGASQHPDYLAYTNEIVGDHPERFVADSDLDWGQDMKRLAVFLQVNGVSQLTFTPFNRTYPLPAAMSASNPGAPSPGWNAASVTLWKAFGDPSWPDRLPPQHRIGRGILVWYFAP